MTSFCEGARNGREMPTITYICFHSPQERGLFQFTCEEFRVRSPGPTGRSLSLRILTDLPEKGKRKERKWQVIYGPLLPWDAMVPSNSS